MIFSRVLPDALWLRLNKERLKYYSPVTTSLLFEKNENVMNVLLTGVCCKLNND
jgi:hypothetical protein